MAATVGHLTHVAALEALPDVELVHRYRRGLEILDARIFELTDAQLDTAFLPDATTDGTPTGMSLGRWPVRVLLGHVADAELVFSHRMRRAVAEDRPMLALFDEDAFVDSGLYGGPEGGGAYPIAGFVTVIHHLRKWTGSWLLTLMPEQFLRTAMHPERGEISVKRMLSYATWHLEHHGEYCNRKVCKMLGPRPVEAASAAKPAGGGGCGAGCGCRK